MSTCFQNKQKRHWALERPKFDNASVVPGGPGRREVGARVCPRLARELGLPGELEGQGGQGGPGWPGCLGCPGDQGLRPEVREDLTLHLQWKRCDTGHSRGLVTSTLVRFVPVPFWV